MRKKFLRTSAVVAIFNGTIGKVSSNRPAMRSALNKLPRLVVIGLWMFACISLTAVRCPVGALPYDDVNGCPAPASVRRAVAAVENAAGVYRAAHSFWKYATRTETSCLDCLFCRDPWKYTIKSPDKAQRMIDKVDYASLYFHEDRVVRDQSFANYDREMQVLKRALLDAVVSDIVYEGDLKLRWVFSPYTDGSLRPDTPLEACVMTLVNGFGGWRKPANVQKDEKSPVK